MDFQTKYSPKSFSELINGDLRNLVDRYVGEKIMEPLLLHGVPGTGKTAFAKMLAANLCDDIDAGDVLFINASLNTGIETMRNKIKNFASCFRQNKRDVSVVIIDEADGFSRDAQNALKGEIDAQRDSVLFILTTNDVNKIEEPIRDRCRDLLFNRPAPKELMPLAKAILKAEGESVPDDLLLGVLSASGGDMMGLSYRVFFRRLDDLVTGRRRRRAESEKAA